jgi:hypothetical protein
MLDTCLVCTSSNEIDLVIPMLPRNTSEDASHTETGQRLKKPNVFFLHKEVLEVNVLFARWIIRLWLAVRHEMAQSGA